MIITKQDLKSHLYTEIIDEIIRGDDTIAGDAIGAAIDEARMFLGRFDTVKLFGESDGEPEVKSPALKAWVKDIAVYQLIKLSNAAVDIGFFMDNYKLAIAALAKVQNGNADPYGWPYREDDPGTPGNEASGIGWSSNPKRRNHF